MLFDVLQEMVSLPHSWTLMCALFLAATSCVPNYAGRNLEGRVIACLDIKFDGPEGFDLNRFNKFIRSQPGTRYSEDVLGEDLRRLYNSGLVDDAQIKTEGSDGWVRLVVEICSRPAGWRGKPSPPRSQQFAITNKQRQNKP